MQVCIYESGKQPSVVLYQAQRYEKDCVW